LIGGANYFGKQQNRKKLTDYTNIFSITAVKMLPRSGLQEVQLYIRHAAKAARLGKAARQKPIVTNANIRQPTQPHAHHLHQSVNTLLLYVNSLHPNKIAARLVA
jgi:hypothetical protein